MKACQQSVGNRGIEFIAVPHGGRTRSYIYYICTYVCTTSTSKKDLGGVGSETSRKLCGTVLQHSSRKPHRASESERTNIKRNNRGLQRLDNLVEPWIPTNKRREIRLSLVLCCVAMGADARTGQEGRGGNPYTTDTPAGWNPLRVADGESAF